VDAAQLTRGLLDAFSTTRAATMRAKSGMAARTRAR
jgi:hypothetical protein